MMTAAASDLAAIGWNVSAAHMVAAARTTSVIAAAADEVSASTAHLFSQHAQDYQALAGQASAFHGQFVQHLTAGAASYTNIEAFITSFLHDLNASVDPFVNFIKSTPQISSGNVVLIAAAVLLSPIWLPVAIAVAISFLAIISIFYVYPYHNFLEHGIFSRDDFYHRCDKSQMYIYTCFLYFTENGYYF